MPEQWSSREILVWSAAGALGLLIITTIISESIKDTRERAVIEARLAVLEERTDKIAAIEARIDHIHDAVRGDSTRPGGGTHR